jgi:hypothetical protein
MISNASCHEETLRRAGAAQRLQDRKVLLPAWAGGRDHQVPMIAVINVCDVAGKLIALHRHKGDFKDGRRGEVLVVGVTIGTSPWSTAFAEKILRTVTSLRTCLS